MFNPINRTNTQRRGCSGRYCGSNFTMRADSTAVARRRNRGAGKPAMLPPSMDMVSSSPVVWRCLQSVEYLRRRIIREKQATPIDILLLPSPISMASSKNAADPYPSWPLNMMSTPQRSRPLCPKGKSKILDVRLARLGPVSFQAPIFCSCRSCVGRRSGQ